MIHILALELTSGDYYEDIIFEGTEEEFRKVLDKNIYIMFKDADGVGYIIPAEKIESIEYLQTNKVIRLDHDSEGCVDECCCADCCAECGAPLDNEDFDEHFLSFVNEDGVIHYDKLLGYVKDEFTTMGISLSHWNPAARAISQIATKAFGHFDSFAPGLSVDAKNEVIFDAIGYASELLDSEDSMAMVDDKFKADMKDHIMAGCTSALVTDFI